MQRVLEEQRVFEKAQSGVFIFVGKPDSGKTHEIRDVIFNESDFVEPFDFYLLISPSKMKGIEYNDDYCNEKLDLAWLADRLSFLEEEIELLKEKEADKCYKLLVVFDDVVSDLNKNKGNSFLNKLFFNRRWELDNCSISYAVSTQQYTVLPTFIRSTTTHIFLFNASEKDIDDVRRDHLTINKTEYNQIYRDVVVSKGEGHFLYLELTPFRMYDTNRKRILTDVNYSLDVNDNTKELIEDEGAIKKKVEIMPVAVKEEDSSLLSKFYKY